MKKIILLLSLLVIAMFLVGCVETTEEIVDVVDEDGNLVGEAFRMPKQGLKTETVQISEGAITNFQCQKQAEDCGFVTKEDLKDYAKVGKIFPFAISYSESKEGKTCTDACGSNGCLLTMGGITHTKYEYAPWDDSLSFVGTCDEGHLVTGNEDEGEYYFKWCLCNGWGD
jgi:hypothetical protein